MYLSHFTLIALFLGSFNFSPHQSVIASNCDNPTVAASTSRWNLMPPAKDDIDVAYYDPQNDHPSWIGLNRVQATYQALKNKRRSFIPWMMPTIVTRFPFRNALQAPANRMPLFYVNHSDKTAGAPDLGSQEIHLVRLRSTGNNRELQASSGLSIFDFKPIYSSNLEVLSEKVALSNTIFTIQPKQKLANGQYLIFFGTIPTSGFEFEINCLEERGSFK